MPAPPGTKKEFAMADAEEFAEIVAKRLLDQGDKLREDLAHQVQEIRFEVGLMRQQAKTCEDNCNRRICILEKHDDEHDKEHKKGTASLITMLIAALSSAVAALWTVFRDRP